MSKQESLSIVGSRYDVPPRAGASGSSSVASASASSSAALSGGPPPGSTTGPAHSLGHQPSADKARKTSAGSKKPTTTSSSAKRASAATAAPPAAANDDDDEEESDKEEIIPKKVPDSSDSEGEEETPATRKATRTTQKQATTNEVGGKTFLSEVDLAELPPLNTDDSSSQKASSSRDTSAEEQAAADALYAHRPRTEWSTETSGCGASEVFCLSWSHDSRYLAAGCGDGTIRIFNATTGKIAYVLRSAATTAGSNTETPRSPSASAFSYLSSSDDGLPITCLRWRPTDGTKTAHVLLSSSADGSITHWHVPTQTCLFRIQEEQDPSPNGSSEGQVYALDYRHDGDQFASGGRDGKIRIYDETTKSLITTLSAGGGGRAAATAIAGGSGVSGSGYSTSTTTGHSNRVYVVKYHPKDENILVSGGWDNTIQIWDIAAGYSIRSIYGPHLCGDALDISLDGTTVVTASWRPHETLQRWDLSTGRLIDTIPFAAGPGGIGGDRPELLYAVSYAPDGRYIAAGGCGTNETKVFALDKDDKNPKAVVRISAGKGGVYALDYAPSGKKLAIGGGGPSIIVVEM